MNITTNAHLLSVLIKAQQVADNMGDDNTVLLAATHHQKLYSPRTLYSASNQAIQEEDLIISQHQHAPEKPKQQQHWKKPKDMPRRPLSAYNLFFKSERQRMVSAATTSPSTPKNKRGKPKSLGIGFGGMARTIAGKWKTISSVERSIFEGQARIEKARYHKEMVVWRMKEAAKKSALKDAADQKKQKQEDAAAEQHTAVSADNASIVAASGYWEEYTEGKTPFDDASDVTDQSLHILIQDMQETISKGGQLCEEMQQERSSTNCSSLHLTMYEPVPISCLEALTFPSSLSSSSQKMPEQEEADNLIDDLSLFMFIMEAGGC